MATFDYHGWTLDHASMVFETIGEQVHLRPTTLLISLDETGSVELGDPAHPVFGIGGCAVLVGHYKKVLGDPWLRLKEQHFGGAGRPLHAAELQQPTLIQLEALGRFFRNGAFLRLAAVLTSQTDIGPGISRLQAVVATLAISMVSILRRVPCSDVMLLFETAYCRGELIWRAFEELAFTRTIEGKRTAIPVHMMHCDKTMNLPSLEVADFIMQAAGGAVRGSLSGRPLLARRDFKVVFGDEPPGWTEFIQLRSFGWYSR